MPDRDRLGLQDRIPVEELAAPGACNNGEAVVHFAVMNASDEDEKLVCGTDGCAGDAREVAALAQPAAELSIVSDAICPWCYVGKRRLEQAVALLNGARQFRVTWRPFELNPDMPKEGIERREYRMRKFGSWERSLAMDAQLTEVGKSVGIAFRYDLMKRTPNTFDAHRLIWFAGNEGAQDAVVEALFRGYFTQGRDIGDHRVLADLAAEAGLDRSRTAAFLASGEGAAEVSAEEQTAKRAGLSGVPTFVLDGRVLFSGAQPPELIARALVQSVTEPSRS
jgi:predicted DsbA family dithiol-disulfide isomerase